MNNIFNENIIPTSTYFFNSSYSLISNDLWYYLTDNLFVENNNTFRWNLRNALTINANGEII
jgi:hypothetical protein